MRILDFHLHFDGNVKDAERFAAIWRKAGVEKAVVFGMNYNDGSHTSARDTAALAARVPDFFIPFAYLNVGYEDCVAGVREAQALGFKGVKFIYAAKPYDDDEYFPIYEAAAKANMVCLFHTGIVVGSVGKGGLHGVDFQGKWRISSDYMRPMRLDRIARAFPDMPIVGAHVGSETWYEEATSMLAWQSNVYFDMSIQQFHYERKNTPKGQEGRVIKSRIRELYDSGQLDLNRILFGSDSVVGNPKADPTWALNTLKFEMEGLGATREETEAVSWGTAARLLGVE
jgi:predicted TIM-barrel fold metal-dependent hydrolase